MISSLMFVLVPLVAAGEDELPFSLAKPPAEVERLVARLHSNERLSQDELRRPRETVSARTSPCWC